MSEGKHRMRNEGQVGATALRAHAEAPAEVPTTDWFTPSESSAARHTFAPAAGPRYPTRAPWYTGTGSSYPDAAPSYLDTPSRYPDTASGHQETGPGYFDAASAYLDAPAADHPGTAAGDYLGTDLPQYPDTSTTDYSDAEVRDYLDTGVADYLGTEVPERADASIPFPRRAAAAEQLSDPVAYLSDPVDYLSTPVQDHPAPTDYDPAPEGYLSAPVQDHLAPTDHDSTPVEFLSVPVEDQPAPIDHGSVPVEFLSVPVERLDSVGCPDATIPAIPRIAAVPDLDEVAAADLAAPAAAPAPELDRPTPPPALARPAVHEGDTPPFGPRRLVTASVVLALIGGGLWLGMARPQHVPPVAAPPAAPPPTAPNVITPQPAAPKPSTPKPSTPKPPASLAPRGPVALAGWKLTLPTASEKGSAASVNPANTSAPYLTRDSNGGLKFWAPVDGTTTPNSKHPRTELVSLKNWKAGNSGKHTLRASLSVAQTPSANQDIIIGQIHGADDISSVPYVMLHYDGGAVRVVVKQQQSGSTSDKYALISGVPLGARFDYTITDQGNGNLTFSATYGSNTRSVTIPISSAFRNATVRFQAGAYQQGESSSGAQDGARLTFYSLNQ